MRRVLRSLPAVILLVFCFLGGLKWGGSKGTAALLSRLAAFGLRPILNGQSAGICLWWFFLDFLLLSGFCSLGWLRPIFVLISLPLPFLLSSAAGVITSLLPRGPETVLLILWEFTVISSSAITVLFAFERAIYHLSAPGADSTDALRLRQFLLFLSAAALTGAILLLCLRKTTFFGFFQTLL